MKEARRSYSFIPSDKEGMYLNYRFSLPAGTEDLYEFAKKIFNDHPDVEIIEVLECINLPGVDSARAEFKEFILRSDMKERVSISKAMANQVAMEFDGSKWGKRVKPYEGNVNGSPSDMDYAGSTGSEIQDQHEWSVKNSSNTFTEESLKKLAELELRIITLDKMKEEAGSQDVSPEDGFSIGYYRGLKKACEILNGDYKGEGDADNANPDK